MLNRDEQLPTDLHDFKYVSQSYEVKQEDRKYSAWRLFSLIIRTRAE